MRRPTTALDPKAALPRVLTTGRPFERPIAPSPPGVSSWTAFARPITTQADYRQPVVRPRVATILFKWSRSSRQTHTWSPERSGRTRASISDAVYLCRQLHAHPFGFKASMTAPS
jgi:hypothetical protein